MRDKSKKLTVINTGEKRTAEKAYVSERSVSTFYRGVLPDLSAYLLKSVWDSVFEIKKTEDGVDYIFTKLPVATQYGVTMYADTSTLDLPSIYAGLPIDNQTLYWEETANEDGSITKVLKSKGGGEGTIKNFSVSGEGNALTDVTLDAEGTGLVFTKGLTFIDETYLEENYLTKTTIQENYLTKDQIEDDYYTKTTIDELYFKKDDASGLFVTLDEQEQYVIGVKTFVNGIRIGANRIYQSQSDVVYLDANLVVRGGITMYGVDEVDVPTLMQSLNLDPETLEIDESGRLTVIGGGGGSIEYALSWSGFSSGSWDGSASKSIYIPSKTSELTNDASFVKTSEMNTALAKYLPLTGGTITGDLRLKDDTNYGRTIYFGDGSYAYIAEDSDDHLKFFANSGIELAANVTINNNLNVLGSMAVKGTKVQTPAGSDTRGFEFQGQYMYVHWDYVSREVIFHLDGNNVVVFNKVPQVTGNGTLATRPWVQQNYITSIGNEYNSEGTYYRYLTYTKGDGTTNKLTVGYSSYTSNMVSTGVSDLNSNTAWNSAIGIRCGTATSSATNLPTTAGSNANGYISFMTAYGWYGFQIGYINQLSSGYDAIPHLFFRNRVAGTYKSWYRIVTNGPQMQFNVYDSTNPRILMRYQSGSWYYIQMCSDGMWLGLSNTNGMRINSGGNLLVTGGITMYSDERKKTILNHVELSLKQIADAPLVEHYYNSDDRKTTHVGSIAQYWAGLNDWFCKKDNEGYYTMEIQNAALASAISIARELYRYETKTDKQIGKLKKRICELEEEVKLLRKG